MQFGPDHPCRIIAEIGINHNGCLDAAKKLIDIAVEAGCDAVKFQKRTVDVVYTKEELERPRESPFGKTNGDLKRGLEFDSSQYTEIDYYCHQKGIAWGASCWNNDSVDFIERFDVSFHKIASACLTDRELLRKYSMGKYGVGQSLPILLSTGGSTMDQIHRAVKEFDDTTELILLHTCSAYPADYEDLNLRMIDTLKQFGLPIGYSGHETGIATSVAAVAMGACVVERHITLDRAMWGSDQAASLGPHGLRQLVEDIRLVEKAMGDGVKRVTEKETEVMKKLRRFP